MADTEPTGDVAPQLTLVPAQVTAGPPGSRVTVGVEVHGLGPSPSITWTSVAPNTIVVESVSDDGRTAVLRFDGRAAGNVVVTARGTHVLVDTLIVAIALARAADDHPVSSGNLTNR